MMKAYLFFLFFISTSFLQAQNSIPKSAGTNWRIMFGDIGESGYVSKGKLLSTDSIFAEITYATGEKIKKPLVIKYKVCHFKLNGKKFESAPMIKTEKGPTISKDLKGYFKQVLSGDCIIIGVSKVGSEEPDNDHSIILTIK